MEEKKQNAISEKKSPLNNNEEDENKEKMEQDGNLYKEENGNKDFQIRVNEEKVEIIPSKSTKAEDTNQKGEKDEENENPKIPTRFIVFAEEVKSKKKERKSQNTPKFYKKNNRRIKGNTIIFAIKKDQKVKYEKKKIILSEYLLETKEKKEDGNPLFLIRKPSSFNSNRGPPPSKKAKLNIRKPSPSLHSNNRTFRQKDDDDDEKMTDSVAEEVGNVSCNTWRKPKLP